jgi:hydrocephalus-inducing protein
MEQEHYRAKKVLEMMKEQQQEQEQFLQQTLAGNRKSDLLDLTLLTQKYRNHTRIVNDEDYPFDEQVFAIEPMQGTIWPGSSCEVRISFLPKDAGDFNMTAYCEIEGRETRLPLHLKVGYSKRSLFEGSHTDLCFLGRSSWTQS